MIMGPVGGNPSGEPKIFINLLSICSTGGGMARGANDASRARVQLSSTRTRKLESELDLSSKARELENEDRIELENAKLELGSSSNSSSLKYFFKKINYF